MLDIDTETMLGGELVIFPCVWQETCDEYSDQCNIDCEYYKPDIKQPERSS